MQSPMGSILDEFAIHVFGDGHSRGFTSSQDLSRGPCDGSLGAGASSVDVCSEN